MNDCLLYINLSVNMCNSSYFSTDVHSASN